ncbi:hypothetical protein PGTUg99_021313 [Puccinia graminis f. sp. tritici]|uniref:Uncharacterized protein n=1 Tax=Puccinia graminis f. sp. tritici TaxID=56615 RepID=A0A5B0S7F3_PUCGR|nr:hypothetical protein PGTUg99_021313 [Puccinia graminis f. sp. tritici]
MSTLPQREDRHRCASPCAFKFAADSGGGCAFGLHGVLATLINRLFDLWGSDTTTFTPHLTFSALFSYLSYLRASNRKEKWNADAHGDLVDGTPLMLQRKPACTGETMKANSLRPPDERKINTINLSKSI